LTITKGNNTKYYFNDEFLFVFLYIVIVYVIM
jgi:hypothetical protein